MRAGRISSRKSSHPGQENFQSREICQVNWSASVSSGNFAASVLGAVGDVCPSENRDNVLKSKISTSVVKDTTDESPRNVALLFIFPTHVNHLIGLRLHACRGKWACVTEYASPTFPFELEEESLAGNSRFLISLRQTTTPRPVPGVAG